MFRNYLSAAWGDLKRSPIQSLIAIGGLAIGLMASIIAGVVTEDLLTRNDFVPGHEQLYFPIMEEYTTHGISYNKYTSYNLAEYLRAIPGIKDAVREAERSGVLQHGAIITREDSIAWTDANFFRLYRVQPLYGDLDHALDRPDGMVVTLDTARKYSGARPRPPACVQSGATFSGVVPAHTGQCLAKNRLRRVSDMNRHSNAARPNASKVCK